MDEGITRNMWSSLQKYNKTVYSRILLDSYWHLFKMHGPMNIKDTAILFLTPFYLLAVGLEGYCCTWSHSVTHSDTPHSVGLFWTSDRPVAELLPDNTQHSRWTEFHAPGRIQNGNPSKRAAVDPRPRLYLQWDLLRLFLTIKHFTLYTCELFALAKVKVE